MVWWLCRLACTRYEVHLLLEMTRNVGAGGDLPGHTNPARRDGNIAVVIVSFDSETTVKGAYPVGRDGA
jgi:hypothetical protein